MNRILIAGYYGFSNIGDEAILEALITKLRNKFNDTKIEVLSANPDKTSKKYNIECVDRKNIFKIIRAIKKCNLLIVGGGSLLQDVTSKKSIYYYLAIIYIGLFLKKKIVMYSQGIGPINEKYNRRLTKSILNKVDYITVRDENSKSELMSMGVSKDIVEVTADPVVGLESTSKEIGLKILKKNSYSFNVNKPTIGFAFRYWKDNKKISRILVDVAKKLSSELDVNIVCIPFHHSEDIMLIEDIEKDLVDKAVFIKERYGVNEVLSIIQNLDMLVGVRLHSLIFSAVAQVPMIAVSYDPKVDFFMQSLGLEALCTIEELETDKFYLHIKNAWENRDKTLSILSSNLVDIRNRLKLNEEIIDKILKNNH